MTETTLNEIEFFALCCLLFEEDIISPELKSYIQKLIVNAFIAFNSETREYVVKEFGPFIQAMMESIQTQFNDLISSCENGKEKVKESMMRVNDFVAFTIDELDVAVAGKVYEMGEQAFNSRNTALADFTNM